VKPFAFIMAVIVLLQSWMPCNDAVFAIKDVKAGAAISAAPQQDDTEHTDSCSPFCQCACCAGFSLNYTIASVASPFLTSKKVFASYLPDHLIEVSNPIWQPPKAVV
jgi:hypothetical protein